MNSGIRYSYTIITERRLTTPQSSQSSQFTWKLIGFGQCNRSCGPGVQPPLFKCTRNAASADQDSDNQDENGRAVRFYPPRLCEGLQKPQFNEEIYLCNRGLCSAYWQKEHFGPCQCPEDNNSGYQQGISSRRVQCVQEQANGSIELVEEINCPNDTQPLRHQVCECFPSNGRRPHDSTSRAAEKDHNLRATASMFSLCLCLCL